MSVCDIVVATQDAMFALSEVRLGLVPAVIAPFLLRKAGASFMRRFCLTAETFSASVARQFNLVHDVVEPETLDSRIGELVEAVLRLAPEAARHTKALLRQIQSSQDTESGGKSPLITNARARLSAEAQEGLRAFFEKRPPAWAKASAEEAIEPRGVKSHHVAGQRIQYHRSRPIRIVEVGPRDGLQNEPAVIPTETKIAFINALSRTGVAEIEAGSFVSPKSVPRMADSDDVFRKIERVTVSHIRLSFPMNAGLNGPALWRRKKLRCLPPPPRRLPGGTSTRPSKNRSKDSNLSLCEPSGTAWPCVAMCRRPGSVPTKGGSSRPTWWL